MRRGSILLMVCLTAAWLTACGSSGEETAAGSSAAVEGEEMRTISVESGEHRVLYRLNDSRAADSLYEQLPLTLEVEDYSTNEKIFYPPEELDVSETPLAGGGAGTLAYYAPWEDVVLFYGDYGANASLYELGEAVSGEESIGQLSGTVTVDASE